MDNSKIKVQIVLDGTEKFKRDLNGTTKSVGQLSGTGKAVSGAFSLIGKTAMFAGAAAVAGLGAMVKSGIEVAASLETTEAGFKTLLGNSKKARKAMEMIKKDAIRTPFDTLGLARLNQQLTGVTKNAERSQKVILDVGEAVIGMGRGTEELDRIIINLQQIGATGRASMIDIRQFAFAGIPIFEMLKKETGLSGKAMEKFISDGKVSFEMIERMFDKANNKGGLFFNAYKNNANTFSQKTAALKESWQNFTSDFVTQTGLIDTAKNVVDELTNQISAKGGLTDSLKVTFKLMKSEDAITVMKAGIKGLTYVVQGLTASLVLAAAALGNAKAISLTTTNMSNEEKKKFNKNAEITKQLYSGIGVSAPPKPQSKQSPSKTLIPKPGDLFKGFAYGGVVGGNKYSGDNVMARVNSGEMILTRGQQSSLFGLIKNLNTKSNINFNGGVNFSSSSSPMQQQNNFVNMLMQLQ